MLMRAAAAPPRRARPKPVWRAAAAAVEVDGAAGVEVASVGEPVLSLG